MTVLHVRAGLTIDPSEVEGSTVGAHADAVARRYGIAGTSFTYKADGVVLEPNQSISPAAQVLELVELSAPAQVEAIAVVEVEATVETKVSRSRRNAEAERDAEAPAQDL